MHNLTWQRVLAVCHGVTFPLAAAFALPEWWMYFHNNLQATVFAAIVLFVVVICLAVLMSGTETNEHSDLEAWLSDNDDDMDDEELEDPLLRYMATVVKQRMAHPSVEYDEKIKSNTELGSFVALPARLQPPVPKSTRMLK